MQAIAEVPPGRGAHNPRARLRLGGILPGGPSFITGNVVGFQPLDVVEQMTREADGETEWSGIWQVVRDGDVIATVDSNR